MGNLSMFVNVKLDERTRVCTVYIMNDRIGSPTFCGSSTEITNNGGMEPFPRVAAGDETAG